LSPRFIAEVTSRAKETKSSVIFVHSHPFDLNEFSDVDTEGEKELGEFLNRRIPGVPHAALLLTPSTSIARRLATSDELHVAEIGPNIDLAGVVQSEIDLSFDRQIRAFGAHGQQKLASICVAVVGLGGTGSLVVQQLGYLGVKHFHLIDPDKVESTNLNRVEGAVSSDIGRFKVDVASALVHRLHPDAKITLQTKTVLGTAAARQLADADFIFCCTDSHGSRTVINQIAYQYLVPTIDMGIAIVARDGKVTHISGRVQMLCPGLSCLLCGNLLDPEEVRRDFLSEPERERDRYIVGAAEPQPSVISFNSTVSSLAVSMFLNAVVGIPGEARFLNYNGLTGMTRSVSGARHPKCVVCSESGSFARGCSWPLPTRDDW